VTELVSNAAVENAAIEYVIANETAQGRTATDTRGKGAPADVKSDGRIIEVKAYGRSARGQDLWLEARQVAEAESNPDFWGVHDRQRVPGQPRRVRPAPAGR